MDVADKAEETWASEKARVDAYRDRGFLERARDTLLRRPSVSNQEARDALKDYYEKSQASGEALGNLEGNVEAAQMYTPEYLAKESDPDRIQELIEANRRGGPMAVSPEMTHALSLQDQMREQMRFYQEKGLDIPYDKMLPAETYAQLKALVGKDYNHNKAAVENLIVMMTAANEVALDYADQKGLPVDQQRLVDSYALGQRITDGVTGGDFRLVYDFVRRKEGRESVSTNDCGYYQIAAAQLERFFNQNRIPDGEARVPYVVAYASGALANGRAMYLGSILRDLIADVIPCAETRWVRKEGKWVEEIQPAKPRGLGSFIEPGDAHSSFKIQKGTTNRGLAETMKKAGDIVRGMKAKFRERRVDYDMINYFEAGKIVDPPVLTPAASVV